ncbi:putative nicotinate-nucleotide adenylyltransferase [Actinomycetes bacterium]|nr:putative nicotinate-nucleotide adenylyltransferase [Actinomycetes bacterium]
MVAINSRTAIFGGTFDPIHRGHLHLITEIVKRNLFEKIIIIPSGKPLLKPTSPKADAESRLEMVRIALLELPLEIQDKLEICTFEVERSESSYAIDSVIHLKSARNASFTWILGSDAAANLTKWHRFEELQELVNFLVVLRPDAKFVLIPGAHVTSIEIDALALSSTEVRNSLIAGKEVASAVPVSVINYIERNGLYASA